MYSKYCFILFIVIIGFGYINAANNKKQLGVMITNTELCPNTVHKMTKNSPLSVSLTVRMTGNHSSVLDININITRSFGPASVSLRVFQAQNDKLTQIFKVEDASCKHPLTFQLIRSLNVTIDKNCMVAKNIIWIKDLDLDKFRWILTKAATSPGKFIYEMEFISDTSCIYCCRLICDVYVKK